MIESLGKPTAFLDKIFNELGAIGIDITNFEMDHICYRVSTDDEYHKIKHLVNENAQLLIDSKINGREISTFKLHTPFLYKNRVVSILELPSPKIGSPYQTGFEHVEFVVDTSLELFKSQYPSVHFNEKAMKKNFNRDLRVDFDGISVKFHEMSLEKVIEIEKGL